MKRNFNTIISIIFCAYILNSCLSYNDQLFRGGEDIGKARKNIIIDFANSYKTPRNYLKERNEKPFNVFWVFKKESKRNMLIFSVSPETNGHIPLGIKDTLGKVPKSYFPNNFEVRENKLFVWKDTITPLRKDILDIMDKYGVLDSTDVKRELNLLPKDFEDTRVVTIDHKLKSVHYYICKERIEKFIKIVTNKAFGNYDLPKLKCNVP